MVALRAELGLREVGPVAVDQDGVPLMSDLLQKAAAHGAHDHLCYVNGDILLLDDFVATCIEAWTWRPDAVLVGSRIDVVELGPLDFADNSWVGDVRAVAQGGSRTCMGSDFFAYPRGAYRDMPPFSVGRTAFDDWMMWKAMRTGNPLLDISSRVTAVHVLHRIPGEWDALMATAGVQRNRSLATTWQRTYTLADCSHVMTANGARPRRLAALRQRMSVVLRVVESRLRGETWF